MNVNTPIPQDENYTWNNYSNENLAYSEGWASFYSTIVRDDRCVVDYKMMDDNFITAEIRNLESIDDVSFVLYLTKEDVALFNCSSFEFINPPYYDIGINFVRRNAGSLYDLIDENDEDGEDNVNNLDQGVVRRIQDIFMSLTSDYLYFGENDIHFPYNFYEFAYSLEQNSTNHQLTQDEINMLERHGTIRRGNYKSITGIPNIFTLFQNHPNPFNPITNMSYILPEKSSISLIIHDILGREVKFITIDAVESGNHTFIWDGKNNYNEDISSGIYFYTIFSKSLSSEKEFIDTKKMVLVR